MWNHYTQKKRFNEIIRINSSWTINDSGFCGINFPCYQGKPLLLVLYYLHSAKLTLQ